MARARLSMRKIKVVLRLSVGGLGNRKIAHICNIGRSTGSLIFGGRSGLALAGRPGHYTMTDGIKEILTKAGRGVIRGAQNEQKLRDERLALFSP